LVGRHHPNTKVAVGFSGGDATAFFAFHPSRNGYVRAVGAPFCDYQAIVTDPAQRVDGGAFLSAANISSVSFSSLMDPHDLLDHTQLRTVAGYRIDTGGNSAVFEAALRAANPKWAKNVRRLMNKMNRELGEAQLVGFDTNPTSFDTLMAIKVAQFQETGVTNVVRSPWVQGMMKELFETQAANFGGCFVSLYAGTKFVAGHFGVRLGSWFHPWIASTCPLSHPYSPGIIFLNEMIRQSDKLGLHVIDLSAGHSHYKAQFCRDPVQVLAGVVGQRTSQAPSQADTLRGLIERRLDLIASVEPSVFGKAQALGMALAALPRRLKTREGKSQNG
jgi:CelD/BcsL family acetyltransferase involved in cellulose biosynthesis